MSHLSQRRLSALLAVVLAFGGVTFGGFAEAGSSRTARQNSDELRRRAPLVERPDPKIANYQAAEPKVLLTLSVTHSDTGVAVNPASLEESYFEIRDNGKKQEITRFDLDPGPVSIALLIDASGSVEEKQYRYLLKGLREFFPRTDPENDYSLIGFNLRPQLIADRTRDTGSLIEKLKPVEPKLNTSVFDAVYLGINHLEGVRDRRKAILLVSDGVDNKSIYTLSEVLQLAKESDVVIYSLCITSASALNTFESMEGLTFLDRLAKITGGVTVVATSEREVTEAFEIFALEFGRRIVIGYTPEGFQEDGKWHKVKVKVKPPKGFPRLSVRYREGYYATPKKSVR